jgi:hypothetical protein
LCVLEGDAATPALRNKELASAPLRNRAQLSPDQKGVAAATIPTHSGPELGRARGSGSDRLPAQHFDARRPAEFNTFDTYAKPSVRASPFGFRWARKWDPFGGRSS